MSEYDQIYEPEKKGSVVTGFIGAFLGSLIGAVLWVLVGLLGYVASVVGMVIGFLSSKGYDLFKGRQGAAKVVCLIICAILAVVIGCAGVYLWGLSSDYDDALAQINLPPNADIMTKYEFIQSCFEMEEIRNEFIKDVLVGLFFAALGCVGFIVDAAKKNRQSATTPPAEVDAFANDSSASFPADSSNDQTDNNKPLDL